MNPRGARKKIAGAAGASGNSKLPSAGASHGAHFSRSAARARARGAPRVRARAGPPPRWQVVCARRALQGGVQVASAAAGSAGGAAIPSGARLTAVLCTRSARAGGRVLTTFAIVKVQWWKPTSTSRR